MLIFACSSKVFFTMGIMVEKKGVGLHPRMFSLDTIACQQRFSERFTVHHVELRKLMDAWPENCFASERWKGCLFLSEC